MSLRFISILVVIFLIQFPDNSEAQCHNRCSGHGTCNSHGRCECYDGFREGDCSQRICPSDVAFSSLTKSSNSVHQVEECSGRGYCHHESGICVCMPGFVGIACERTSCQNNCYNKGMCVSYQQMAATTLSSESQTIRYDHVWDAEKIYGCICDEGYTGYDCSVRKCPKGDDPMTPGGVQEMQLLRCDASTGEFALYFEGQVSNNIHVSASKIELKKALESIPKIGNVAVDYSHGLTVCNDARNIVSITFLDLFGPLPPLVAVRVNMNDDAVIEIGTDDTNGMMIDDDGNDYFAVKGDKENDFCSNRGLCDHGTGTCKCFDDASGSYAGSNGYGEAGDRGDCGYLVGDISDCPGKTPCSDHGVCDSSTKRCTCEEGFSGGDCSLRVCPFGWSWFSYPSEPNVGHNEWVECSKMGICDRSLGECVCIDGFFGAACEYMSCPGGEVASCSGHGTCLTVKTKARLQGEDNQLFYGSNPNNASSWDADRIFGCDCDEGYERYDCSFKSCTSGKDPLNTSDLEEVCSNHGICDGSSGTCICFDGWGDSDGDGNAGDINDCGHRLSVVRQKHKMSEPYDHKMSEPFHHKMSEPLYHKMSEPYDYKKEQSLLLLRREANRIFNNRL